jgi:hypothetical protein
LGRILNAILSGERAPDLSALPEELAGAAGDAGEAVGLMRQ